MARRVTTSTRNKLLQQPKGYQPVQRGRDNRIYRTANGQYIIFPPNEDWWHPWRINAGWDFNLSKWCLWVTPGFVNGYPPIIPVPANTIKRKVVPAFTSRPIDFGINPLSGDPYFSAWIFNKPKDQQTTEEQQASTTPQDVYITDEMKPFLTCGNWYNALGAVTTQDTQGNPVSTAATYPDFFTLLDVAPPDAAQNFDPDAGTTTINSFSANLIKPGNRQLISVDLFLDAEHSAIKSDVYQTDPATGSITIVSNAFTSGDTRFPFRLRISNQADSAQAYPTIEDKLNGSLEEPTFDTLRIARLWMVSPPDANEGDLPDEQWEPFYQHFVFWNLGYMQPNFILQQTPYDPVTINVPLGLGLLALIGNQLLAPLNDANQNILNALNQSSSQGVFYTF